MTAPVLPQRLARIEGVESMRAPPTYLFSSLSPTREAAVGINERYATMVPESLLGHVQPGEDLKPSAGKPGIRALTMQTSFGHAGAEGVSPRSRRSTDAEKLAFGSSATPHQASPYSHRKVDSLMSTEAATEREGSAEAMASMETEEQAAAAAPAPLPVLPRWGVDLTFTVGDAGALSDSELAEVAHVLPKNQVKSVGTAIDLLNRRAIAACSEDFCIVFSESKEKYFCLYRRGTRELALARFGLDDDALLDARVCAEKVRAASQEAKAAREERSRSFSGAEKLMRPVKPVPSTGSPKKEPSEPPVAAVPGMGDFLSKSMREFDKERPVVVATTGREAKPVGGLTKLAAAAAAAAAKDNAKAATQQLPPQEAAAKPSTPSKEVDIGGRIFLLEEIVGRGAFGVVHMGKERGAPPEEPRIAVKVVKATSTQAFQAAAFEAEVLRLLTVRLPKASWDYVPRYLSHSTTRAAGGRGEGGELRLAMSFIKGVSLDQWMYALTDEDHKGVDARMLANGELKGGQQRTLSLAGACSLTRSLLLQIGSVMSVLQSIAFHRDVSSHNILIDAGQALNKDASAAKFALIDFGLAVRSGTWQREWNTANLAGDPRYWAPATWMAFAYGFRYVETSPNRTYLNQYFHRLDHYSVGILGLEILFATWNTAAEEHRCPRLAEAHEAWKRYWYLCMRFFQMFHRNGPQDLRTHLARSTTEGLVQVTVLLRQLCTTLRTAAAAAQQSDNGSLAQLLLVLADLIDERGQMVWSQMPMALKSLPVALMGEDGHLAAAARPRPQHLDASQVTGMAANIRPLQVNATGLGGSLRRLPVQDFPDLSPAGSAPSPEVRRYVPADVCLHAAGGASPRIPSNFARDRLEREQQLQRFGIEEAQRIAGDLGDFFGAKTVSPSGAATSRPAVGQYVQPPSPVAISVAPVKRSHSYVPPPSPGPALATNPASYVPPVQITAGTGASYVPPVQITAGTGASYVAPPTSFATEESPSRYLLTRRPSLHGLNNGAASMIMPTTNSAASVSPIRGTQTVVFAAPTGSFQFGTR
eukprot:TRINITY_DN7492_c0_g1_i1.p1 TRINITY_DN7492_c0_g1~~TRINITY_DN7492_c0_g1_i1.p1  ORF type:complete len:1043 (+),score=199.62 TRINITY_DN7492_c0_g1_i1:69-3197(+)